MSDLDWSIRKLLNPVVTRLLIYGINPMDLEYVMAQVENSVIINTKSLEKIWLRLWEEKASLYRSLAEKALSKDHNETACNLFMAAAQCYFAIYLINSNIIEEKARIYEKLQNNYFNAARLFTRPVEKVELDFIYNKHIAAYLHLPNQDSEIKGAVVFYAGLGSCKEEMNTVARTLAKRGIAVLIPDMPGCGESLFKQGISCNFENVNLVYSIALDFLQNHGAIRGLSVGSAGLCMGGGYAYNAAVLNPEYAFCATLFPLFINQVPADRTPQWMKSGQWFDYQTGNADADVFQASMSRVTSEKLACPFYLVHGKYDNWMTLEDALELLKTVKNPVKDKLIIDQEPVFSKDTTVLHTMPVGEQMHWVRHLFADWILERLE